MGNCCSTAIADDPAKLAKDNNAHQLVATTKTPQQTEQHSTSTPASTQQDINKAVKQRQMQKRIAIAAEAITSASDVTIPAITKTDAARQIITKAMEGNLLFKGLSLAAREAIISSMSPMTFKKGDIIVKQGDTMETNKYYVVDRGVCEVLIKKDDDVEERVVHVCQPGSGFGELALLYSAPRSATVRAAADGRLWVMERPIYIAIKRSFEDDLRKQKRSLVDQVPMLSVLAPEHKSTVADALDMVEFPDAATICQQGEPGDKFFIIKEGTVRVLVDNRDVAKLNPGAFFGERALICDEPRTATVISEGYVVVFALSRKSFNELLGPIEKVWRYESLRKVPILCNLSEGQLLELAHHMTSVQYDEGDVVFRQGDAGDTFYVVEEGVFSVTNAAGDELARCGKGQCFGELALLRNEPRAATVTAIAPSKVLACSRQTFNSLLGSLADIRNMWRFEALSKVPLLTPLSQKQRLTLCSAFVAKNYAPGEAIITKGEAGDTFFVIEKGSCIVYGDGDKELVRIGPASYFGERALLRKEPRAATVRAACDSSVLCLGRADFEKLLGPVEQALRETAAGYDATISVSKITKALVLDDFEEIALLGAGAFGRVTLVKYDGKYYALKALSKAHVIQSGLANHIKRERALMGEFHFPFLVSLVAAFKDPTHLYMVMEVVQGGEFFAYLQSKDGALSESEARFYAACVVLGLEYMHDQGIAWRDLKPENLLLDTAGYLKITDFGFAKRIPAGSRSYTLCGTPEYLAPELVTQSGHNRYVDWWAFGVLVYEMVAGFPPFHQEDRVAMFKAICEQKYHMPEHFSPELADFIRRLLVRVPNRRLGCMQGGIAEVKQHPWFNGFDWGLLAQRKMKAPYLPKVSSPDDASNFDASHVDRKSDASSSSYISTGNFKDF